MDTFCVGALDVLALILAKVAQFAHVTNGCGVTGYKPAKAVVSVSGPPQVRGLPGMAEVASMSFINWSM